MGGNFLACRIIFFLLQLPLQDFFRGQVPCTNFFFGVGEGGGWGGGEGGGGGEWVVGDILLST